MLTFFISYNAITDFWSQKTENKLKTFEPQKWKKVYTAYLKWNLMVLIKKSVFQKKPIKYYFLINK